MLGCSWVGWWWAAAVLKHLLCRVVVMMVVLMMMVGSYSAKMHLAVQDGNVRQYNGPYICWCVLT